MADERGAESKLAGLPCRLQEPRAVGLVAQASAETEADALRYRLLARHLGAVAFQLDARGCCTLLGSSWQQLTGMKAAPVLGTPLVDTLHPLDREPVSKRLRFLTARELESFQEEVRVLTREGTRWVELFAQVSPGARGEVVGLLTDITARRQAQQTTTIRERCLAAVVDVQRRLLSHSSEDTLYRDILEPLGRAVGAGRAYVLSTRQDELERRLVSYKAEWCMAGVPPQLGLPQTQDFRLEELLRTDHALLLSTGQPLQFLLSECPPKLRSSLEARHIRAVLLLPLRSHGELIGFLGFDNCTQERVWEEGTANLLAAAAGTLAVALERLTTDALRARAEATLRSTEAGLHLLIEGFPDPVCVHSENRVLYVNPAAVRYLGHEGPDTLLGRPVLMLVRVADHPAMLRHLAEARAGLAAREQEVTLLRQDGQERLADLATLRVTFDGQPALVTIARDFTERKQLQARLMLSDRMATMGTLAAGIAHELNNPLSYVIANLDFVHGDMQPGGAEPAQVDEWREVLGDAREGAERVRQIVRQLKAFSRVDEERQEPVDLHRVLDSVAQMAANEVRHRARLVKDYGALPEVLGNDGKLFQVFLNLVINAAHAIAEGQVDSNEIRLVTRTDSRGWATVEVRDTGGGIRPEHLSRLFEPFFTTKPQGVGTGLGLAICHALVRSHGGDISVQSTVGTGTTFRVVLPPMAAGSRVVLSPAPMPVASPMRVLIIDDEPAVAAALGRMLEGHRVELAHGGVVGQEMLLRGQGYDVIFCDLLMPERTGMELYAQAIALHPALAHRFIFMTGGGFTPRAREFLASGQHRVLDKPFVKRDVQRLLIEVLSRTR